jgi:ATP-dependent Clp protease, protease subunit
VSGNASQLAAWAEQHRVELERFVKRLARATGRPAEHLEADLSLGRWLSADDALRYGLVDEIWGPGHGPSSPPAAGPARPFGFGPSH